MMNDEPRIWTEEIPGEVNEEDYYTQESSNELTTIEEPQLPSVEEQEKIVKSSNISEKNKSMLGELIELTKVSEVLTNITNSELEEKRKSLTQVIGQMFVQARMQNNMKIENLKQLAIDRLISNLENMDLALTHEVLATLSQITSVDAAHMYGAMFGTGGSMQNLGGGTTVNLNLANGEGSQITTQTLNANPQQVQQLKEVASLNSSLKAWSNIPGKKPTIQAQIIDNNGK